MQHAICTHVIKGIKGVRSIADNLIVLGKNREEHDANQRALLEHLRYDDRPRQYKEVRQEGTVFLRTQGDSSRHRDWRQKSRRANECSKTEYRE